MMNIEGDWTKHLRKAIFQIIIKLFWVNTILDVMKYIGLLDFEKLHNWNLTKSLQRGTVNYCKK